jgi:hypothetical protein
LSYHAAHRISGGDPWFASTARVEPVDDQQRAVESASTADGRC